MTARDDAISHMINEEAADWLINDVISCGQLLDAIPAHVHARLAIDGGALQPVLSSFWKNVYRLVEP